MDKKSLDLELFILSIVFIFIGLLTIYPFGEDVLGSLFFKQLIFAILFILTICVCSNINYSFLNSKRVVQFIYLIGVISLLSLLFFATEINGAKSWFNVFGISIQPVEFIKIILIISLSRYLARRHIRIRLLRHLVVSIILTLIFFILVLFQPDLGSAVVLLGIWFGIIFVSGISKKHLFSLIGLAILLSITSWQFIFTDSQKDRVGSFIDPLADLSNTGYNAYQSKVAVGSGGFFGKGIGEGTQSKLNFLPLHESDFIFAAYAEEWGFVGVLILLILFIVFFYKLIILTKKVNSNFEVLFIVGFISLVFSHIFLHIGVNIGLLPVTGITMPFLSYGGSHLLAEAILLGMIMSFVRNSKLTDDVYY